MSHVQRCKGETANPINTIPPQQHLLYKPTSIECHGFRIYISFICLSNYCFFFLMMVKDILELIFTYQNYIFCLIEFTDTLFTLNIDIQNLFFEY